MKLFYGLHRHTAACTYITHRHTLIIKYKDSMEAMVFYGIC